MTSSFDAYDLMRRSILSSIMGLRRKPRPRHSTEQGSSPGSSFTSSSVSRPIQHVKERTPHDIYREIVDECEQIERSGPSSPKSDFDPSPTPPPNSHVASPSSTLVTSPFSYPMGPFIPEQVHPYSPILPREHFAALPPPPYSLMSPTCMEDIPIFAEALLEPSLEQPILTPQHVKQEEKLVNKTPDENSHSMEELCLRNAFSIEEIVKMVITAMKVKASVTEVDKESPEEILRRKRHQNNQAAARYRKRQREARDLAEGELDQLLRRNEDLRQTVERMQQEIAELKKAVLSGGRP